MDQEMDALEGSRCDSSQVYPCPSFSSYSPGGLTSVANRVRREEVEEEARGPPELPLTVPCGEDRLEGLHHSWHEDDDDADFEFVSLVKNSNPSVMGGNVGQVFPVFNRNLLTVGGGSEAGKEEVERSIRDPLKSLFLGVPDPPSCSSSEADELDCEPEGKYCFWAVTSPAAQSPARCKKSNSTGSCPKRWRFLDLLRRSNSEGKDSFAFLSPSSSSSPTAGGKGSKEKRSSSDEPKTTAAAKAGKTKATKEKVAAASAHETFYVRSKAMKEGDRRRSYLPYRKDLVGIFANLNGLSRSFAPF
ncbi:hypothetical protein SAY86_007018 [Trapa natans]|uniref:Uncharacterized protein n=1 Tax=Trapa natans TaxID=22666 RepID=A0AAN7QWL2_TRANT|nr:hypothetical protein SAY86_007018 [Trapa natans]